MPENLKDLYHRIWDEAQTSGLSVAQRHYAVGWIFFDLFERVEHEEKRNGGALSADALNGLACEIPDGRITRSIEEAQEEFGRAAAQFMEDEIQSRIASEIDRSVVAEVKTIKSDLKSYTGSLKAFLMNVTAGITAGLAFAVILMILGTIWESDPSPVHLEKSLLGAGSTNPPAAPPPPPAPPGLPEGR